MVKALYAVNRRGLTDWLIQNISAFIMVIYTIGIMVFFISHPELDFTTWHTLFEHGWMKGATIILFALLLFHAWIGVWTVITDYIKCAVVRLSLYIFILLALVALFLAAVAIMWGV